MTGRSVFQKDVEAEFGWSFELGFEKEIDVSTYVSVGFQERDWRDNQKHKDDVLVRFPVSCTHCVNGDEKYPDVAMNEKLMVITIWNVIENLYQVLDIKLTIIFYDLN